jgi:hypothetical protein
MCLNETYSGVRIGKNLSDKFTIQNGLNQEDAFELCFGICHQEGPRETGRTDMEWDTSACADDANIVGEKVDTIEKNTEALLVARK